MLCCRYSSESALETLGAAFEDACCTLGDFHNVFHHQLAVSGGAYRPARAFCRSQIDVEGAECGLQGLLHSLMQLR